MEGDLKSQWFQEPSERGKERLIEHDTLRRYLNGQIPQRDLKNLKDSIRTMELLEPKFLDDHVHDFSDIFCKFCSEKIISVGKYAQLIMLFQCNHLIALAEHVLEIQKNFPPAPPPPTPNYDLPKPFEETRGKTNIHAQDTIKPDPDMAPGAGMDVRVHTETLSEAADSQQQKNLSEPYDLVNAGEGDCGYYGRSESDSDSFEQLEEQPGEKEELQQQIVQPARLVARQEPKDTNREAEMMQCDSDPQKEGMMSSNFPCVAAYQPPVSQREITEATDGVSHMQIDPPDPGPMAEPIVSDDDTRCGIPPPSYTSMYPNPGRTPQRHGRVIPCPPQVPQPPRADIVQSGNVSGIGNMGNFYVGGEMSFTSKSDEECHEQPTKVTTTTTQKGKRPAGTSATYHYQTSGGAPLKKGSDVVRKVSTEKVTQVPRGHPGQRPSVHQTCDVSGMGNIGNMYCAGNMTFTKTIRTNNKKRGDPPLPKNTID